jgi:hypothetical protein
MLEFVGSGRLDDFRAAAAQGGGQGAPDKPDAGVYLSDLALNPDKELRRPAVSGLAGHHAPPPKRGIAGLKDALPFAPLLGAIAEAAAGTDGALDDAMPPGASVATGPALMLKPGDVSSHTLTLLFRPDEHVSPPLSMYAPSPPVASGPAAAAAAATTATALRGSRPPSSAVQPVAAAGMAAKPPSSGARPDPRLDKKDAARPHQSVSIDRSQISGKSLGQVRDDLMDEERRSKVLEVGVLGGASLPEETMPTDRPPLPR